MSRMTFYFKKSGCMLSFSSYTSFRLIYIDWRILRVFSTRVLFVYTVVLLRVDFSLQKRPNSYRSFTCRVIFIPNLVSKSVVIVEIFVGYKDSIFFSFFFHNCCTN